MRRYRIAVIAGIISVVLLSAAFILYQGGYGELRQSRARLSAVRGESHQFREYRNKISAIKNQSSQLTFLSRERDINIDYEIELTNSDLGVLLDEISKSYSGMIIFLEQAMIESTVEGLTVRIRGCKRAGAAQP